jgi:hypothetical protein
VSVIGGKVIFCEGKQTSLDNSLLEHLIRDLQAATPPTIVPAGSKFTFTIFAQGYFFPDEDTEQPYIVFRDRDFDLPPAEDVRLLQMPKQPRVFLTHRACIENYLLDADLLDQYWTEKQREKDENPASRWGHKGSPGVPVLAEWIKASAKDLKDYQSARWALADLVQILATRQQLQTTWTGKSGQLPASLTLADCQAAGAMVNQFREVSGKVTVDHFEQSLEKYQKVFSQPTFWERQEYLIWFHGKDLQKRMQQQRQGYISLDTYFQWAVKRLDFKVHADLCSLRKEIEALVNQ